jgi:hypothetical protein
MKRLARERSRPTSAGSRRFRVDETAVSFGAVGAGRS